MRLDAHPIDLHPSRETDSTGDIDLSLIDHNLSLSPADRIRQHDRALAMVEAFREAGRRHRLAAKQSRPAPAAD